MPEGHHCLVLAANSLSQELRQTSSQLIFARLNQQLKLLTNGVS
jgi:hypothetical protein